MDSVYDMSFSRVGSLGHGCSASGVRPGMKHISGLLSHLPQYLFILRVSNRKMLKKRKEKKKLWVGIIKLVFVVCSNRASLIAQLVKNPPAMQRTLL